MLKDRLLVVYILLSNFKIDPHTHTHTNNSRYVFNVPCYLIFDLCVCGAISVWPWYVVIPKYSQFFFPMPNTDIFEKLCLFHTLEPLIKKNCVITVNTEKKHTNWFGGPICRTVHSYDDEYTHTHTQSYYTHSNETHDTHIIKRSCVMMHYNEHLPHASKEFVCVKNVI